MVSEGIYYFEEENKGQSEVVTDDQKQNILK